MVEELKNPEAGEPVLDRGLIVSRMQEFGVSIEPEDLEGEDDNDVMGVIATFAMMDGYDIDEIFPEVLPIVKRRHEEDGEPSEIPGAQ